MIPFFTGLLLLTTTREAIQVAPPRRPLIIRSMGANLNQAWDRKVKLGRYQGIGIQAVLRDLCKQVGVDLHLSPEVVGRVTTSAEELSFEHALQRVVRQVNATYRYDQGPLNVIPHVTPICPKP